MVMLISVCAREITAVKYDSFKAARKAMVKQLIQSGVEDSPELHDEQAHEHDDFAIYYNTAWSNGRADNDWRIVVI